MVRWIIVWGNEFMEEESNPNIGLEPFLGSAVYWIVSNQIGFVVLPAYDSGFAEKTCE
jgi:hypothetical protein